MSNPEAGASSPKHATPRQWRDVLVQSARDLWTVNAPEWAAALAFYAVLSLFPLLLVTMVAASYLVDVEWATDQATALMGRYLPEGEQAIEEVVRKAIDQREQVGVVSFVVFVFTGRRILGGITKGLNLVSDVDVHDDTVKRRVVVEAGMLLGLALMVVLAFGSRRLGEAASQLVSSLPGNDGSQLALISGIVHAVLLLLIFSLVYTFVPRGKRHWQSVLVGAAVATALFLAAQGVFGLVLDRLWRNLSLVYGPFAVAVLLLTWAWYVALITLAGGAVASHTKVMVLEGRSAGTAREQHVGGAA